LFEIVCRFNSNLFLPLWVQPYQNNIFTLIPPPPPHLNHSNYLETLLGELFS
jgi:hypothetical protein